MDWNEAKAKIEKTIVVGTDLNTSDSTYRKVLKTNHICESKRYNYNGEKGFRVQIGKNKNNDAVCIPWSMLERCFLELKKRGVFNIKVFREYYPDQCKDHPCHVHVVGMIFVKAGIATLNDNGKEKNYLLLK